MGSENIRLTKTPNKILTFFNACIDDVAKREHYKSARARGILLD
jgi:hypothetical protein